METEQHQPIENEMPPLLPDEMEPAQAEESFVLEELTRSDLQQLDAPTEPEETDPPEKNTEE